MKFHSSFSQLQGCSHIVNIQVQGGLGLFFYQEFISTISVTVLLRLTI